MTIAIDAGHGGVDSGVTGVNSGVTEADINLSLALKLEEKLLALGYAVVMTRSTEDGLYGDATENLKMADLTARADIINEAEADILISIHCNQFPSSDRRGGQVFYDDSSDANALLASLVQTELNELNEREVGTSYSALSGDYYILKATECTSIIIESGFMSNEEDDLLLNKESYQEELVSAFIKGLECYISQSYM